MCTFTVIPVTEHTLVCCYNLLGKLHVKIAQTTNVHMTWGLGFYFNTPGILNMHNMRPHRTPPTLAV